MALTERFDDALAWASDLHRAQVRKGTTIPYVSHLLAVTGRVLEDGGDEDEAIAALLHDAVEDQEVAVADIEARFGPRVAEIVAGCSDTDQHPKPPWRQRKEAYLRRLADPSTAMSVLRVSAADKVHNLRSILRELEAHGDVAWDRFNAGPDEQRWYFRQLDEVIARRFPGPLADELHGLVEQLGTR